MSIFEEDTNIYIYEGARRVNNNGGMLPESEILIILIVKEVIGRVSQKKDTVGSVDRNSSRKPCTGRVLKGECPCAKG